MPNPVKLGEFQRWMLEVVTHFGSDAEAWNSEAATAELSHRRALENVLPSPTLNAYERIGIYRRMYFLHMRDALEVDVPSVQHFVGREEFERIVEDYFTRYPSRSYTLNDTGLNFPRFLRESALPQKEFLAELAELELAIARVMDALEIPALSPESISAIPPGAFHEARFQTVSAFEVCAFEYPVHEYLSAFEDEFPAFPDIAPRPNYLYIHRSDYTTRRFDLNEEEYRLLASLGRGTPLGEAFEEALLFHEATTPKELEAMQHTIAHRFQEWIMRGVFASVAV